MIFSLETSHRPTRICNIIPICISQIKQTATRSYVLPSKATGDIKKQCPDRWPMVGAFGHTQPTPTT